MDFRFKFLLILIIFSSCEKEIIKLEPFVGASNIDLELTDVNPHFIKSDFYNFDSMEFTFSHYEPGTKDSELVPVFVGKNMSEDRLQFSFSILPYKNFTEYYAGGVKLKSNLNKLSGQKISGEGSGPLVIKKINDNEAEIRFDIKIDTDYRLPNSKYLEAQILGRLRLPLQQ